MDVKFERAFLKAIKKHAEIKKQIEKKVLQIIEHPVEMGEPLKGNFRGYYSCPVKRNFIIISCTAVFAEKREMMNLSNARIALKHRMRP